MTPGLLAVLGAVPLQGRLFVEEDRAATVPVALISESLWRGGFGADPGIVGRDITLNEAHYHVVGVLPSSFRYPEVGVEVWRALPPSAAPLDERGGRGAMVTVALLANGVTSRQADAELLAMSDRLRQTSRLRADQLLVTDRPLQQRAMDRYKPALFAMLGAVMLVLMMAAINVVNLLLFAIRACGNCAILAALGASRAGLARAPWRKPSLFLRGRPRAGVGPSAPGGDCGDPAGAAFLPLGEHSHPHTARRFADRDRFDLHLRSRQCAPGVARHPRGPRRCSAAPIHGWPDTR